MLKSSDLSKVAEKNNRKTNFKNTEKDLRESNRKYENLFNYAPVNYFILNEEGVIFNLNITACKTLGYSKSNILNKSLASFCEDKEQLFLHLKNVFKTKKEENCLIRLKCKMGNFYVKLNSQIVENETTNVPECWTTMTDIDCVKKTEIKYCSYVNNSPDGVYVVDLNGNYLDVNQAACNMVGYSKEELLQMTIKDLASPQNISEVIKQFKVLINKGRISDEILIRKKDGDNMWMQLDAIKISPDLCIGFAKDITEKKKTEETLKKSKDKAEKYLNI